MVTANHFTLLLWNTVNYPERAVNVNKLEIVFKDKHPKAKFSPKDSKVQCVLLSNHKQVGVLFPPPPPTSPLLSPFVLRPLPATPRCTHSSSNPILKKNQNPDLPATTTRNFLSEAMLSHSSLQSFKQASSHVTNLPDLPTVFVYPH